MAARSSKDFACCRRAISLVKKRLRAGFGIGKLELLQRQLSLQTV